MMKKIWFMLVLWIVLMISGCSVELSKECDGNKVVSDATITEVDVAEVESDVGVEDSTTEEPTADTTTTEADAEPSTTEATSEPEATDISTATPPVEQQPATPEQTTPTPSTELLVTEDSALPATDDRGNPVDGSPVFEITFNIPETEYVGYDADRVARLAVEKCKAAGMITLPENLDRLLAEGEITQDEYNEYYPYDGCGYYSVFVETNLNLASTIGGKRLCSEEEIADYIAGMMVLEVEPFFYIECAGVYQGNSVEFYEFRCYR